MENATTDINQWQRLHLPMVRRFRFGYLLRRRALHISIARNMARPATIASDNQSLPSITLLSSIRDMRREPGGEVINDGSQQHERSRKRAKGMPLLLSSMRESEGPVGNSDSLLLCVKSSLWNTFEMKTIAWSQGQWSREPVSITHDEHHLIVEAAEGSDWWRTTSYGFIHDNGHGLISEFPADTAMEVSFILDYREQFDQCGIFIFSDSEHWVKSGVEFCDGAPQLGAVVTDLKSDWSVAPVPEWFGKEVTVRASRSGDAITLRAKCDGDFQLVRVLPINPDADWKAGPMVCSPMRAGLKVRFTRWASDAADSALH